VTKKMPPNLESSKSARVTLCRLEALHAQTYSTQGWYDVVRIEAMARTLSAHSRFGWRSNIPTGARLRLRLSGYWDIVESLHTRFPSISPTWYDEMSEQPWHVERVLYDKVVA
jgi:hypothetical protein